MTGENCWATAPLSPRCWTACCITDTFSSAARAAGEPRPAVREKANDKSKSKGDKDAAQSTPGGVVTQDPEASTPEPRHRNLSRNTKPSARPAHQANRRGSRSPISKEPAPSSALDHSARRDPGEANTTLTRIQMS